MRAMGRVPQVDLPGRPQDYGNGLGVNWRDDGVGLRRQEGEKLMLALDRCALRAFTPRQGVRESEERPVPSLRANHMDVLRGFVSAYSQNEVAGDDATAPADRRRGGAREGI